MCKEQSNEKAVALQTQPDSSYGLPLETGCPSCPALLQLSLLLFLKAESHQFSDLSAYWLTPTVELKTEASQCRNVTYQCLTEQLMLML